MLMLNNVYPWSEPDYCLNDSWYLANDVWFMLISLNMVEKYLKNKKLFFIQMGLLTVVVLGIQAI